MAQIKLPTDPLANWAGGLIIRQAKSFCRIFVFFFRMIIVTPLIRRNPHLTIDQMIAIGISSLPLVILTSVFVGGVTTWQAAYQFAGYVPLTYLGTAVGKSVMLELSPVLTALVITGRIGASMTAELGTMRVTEQIDAMECLALDPFKFLLAPRLVASIFMLPVLTIISAFVAIISAMLVAQTFFGLEPSQFWKGAKMLYCDYDMFMGVMKAFVFGTLIALFGCFNGFNAEGGAEGVGKATKHSVVVTLVTILITNYLVIALLLHT